MKARIHERVLINYVLAYCPQLQVGRLCKHQYVWHLCRDRCGCRIGSFNRVWQVHGPLVDQTYHAIVSSFSYEVYC